MIFIVGIHIHDNFHDDTGPAVNTNQWPQYVKSKLLVLCEDRRASDAEFLCLPCSGPDQALEGTVELPVTWDDRMLIWCYCNSV